MENKKQKENHSITSKGGATQISGISLELGDEFESSKDRFLPTVILGGIVGGILTASLKTEEGYKELKESFSLWTRSNEELKVEGTQSESKLEIKDETINTLAKLLKNKEKTNRKLRFEISQKNKKIDDLQTTQKLRLEKTIKENTIEIKKLREKINRFQENLRPPSLTQEKIDKYLSIFITEDQK